MIDLELMALNPDKLIGVFKERDDDTKLRFIMEGTADPISISYDSMEERDAWYERVVKTQATQGKESQGPQQPQPSKR